jgi:hypothetical protein
MKEDEKPASQTHHRGRPKLTGEGKTKVKYARDISGADSAEIHFPKRFKH